MVRIDYQQRDAQDCPECGTEIGPNLLACPSCHWLVHGEKLKQLAATAAEATEAGHLSEALEAWNLALELLPHNSRQFASIANKIGELNRRVEAGEGRPPRPGGSDDSGGSDIRSKKPSMLKRALGVGSVGILIAGLTKAKTIYTMILSAGVMATVVPWQFAVGLILAIYVHEIGHVVALKRYGIPASAPMFIPGVGAIIRSRQRLHDPIVNARVGLAGPIWGLAASAVLYVGYLATQSEILAQLAKCSGLINLFNLLPVWSLDGARGFSALSMGQRWLVTLTFGLGWLLIPDSHLLPLLAVVSGVRALTTSREITGDRTTLIHFLGLILALSPFMMIGVGWPWDK